MLEYRVKKVIFFSWLVFRHDSRVCWLIRLVNIFYTYIKSLPSIYSKVGPCFEAEIYFPSNNLWFLPLDRHIHHTNDINKILQWRKHVKNCRKWANQQKQLEIHQIPDIPWIWSFLPSGDVHRMLSGHLNLGNSSDGVCWSRIHWDDAENGNYQKVRCAIGLFDLLLLVAERCANTIVLNSLGEPCS